MILYVNEAELAHESLDIIRKAFQEAVGGLPPDLRVAIKTPKVNQVASGKVVYRPGPMMGLA